MHIVHVEDHFLPTSGYQINFLTKWHVYHGHKATIVTSKSLRPWTSKGFINEEFEKQIEVYDRKFTEETGVKVIRLPTLGSVSSRQIFYPNIFKIVENLRPDVVMVHGNDTLTGMRFICKSAKLKYPLIFDNHMAEVASENRFNNQFRWFYRNFITPIIKKRHLTVVALADDVKRYCMTHYNIPENLLPVVSWGVDTSLFKPSFSARRRFREKYNINENDFVCIYTGKISLDKKVHLLAQAFVEKFNVEKNVVLIVVGSGSGEYYEKTKKLFEKSNNRIIMFPTVPMTDLPQFYQAADLAIWPGACSLSFFDAQATGLPVIAEDIEANRVRITPERANGFLYSVDDWHALRECIYTCLGLSSTELRKIGENGRAFVTENYSYDKVTREIENIMLQILRCAN